jgi:signal transduction histidine kinase
MEYSVREIIDLKKLEALMQKFYKVTGTGAALLDLNGEVLMGTDWQDICTKFHRVNPEMCKRCVESDTALANKLKEGQKYNVYNCLNGLVDVAVPVIIEDKHIANLFIGQFLSKEPDHNFFRKQAKEFGLNEKAYMEALDKVQVLSEDEVKTRIEFLVEIASFIGETGMAKIDLKNLMSEQDKKIEDRTSSIKDLQIATLNMMQDAEEARMESENLNAELNKTLSELKRSNEELQQFAYVASHDLQEPLRMISSYTQLLERKYKDKLDEKAKMYIDYAVDGAERMQSLINDLLAFSRVTTKGEKFKKTDLNKILKNVLLNLATSISENNAQINTETMPTINVDEGQINRVFQNLIANAIKFKGDNDPVVNIKVEKQDQTYVFSVKDNGIGIDKKFFDKIFIIFQRLHTRRDYPGTGIGLAICKRIINRHGGEIWIESEPGKGSEFKFSLPLNPKAKINEQ